MDKDTTWKVKRRFLATDGNRWEDRQPTHRKAADDLPPMGIGGKTANLWPRQRFAVVPPTAVGGKQFLGGVGVGWRWTCRLPSAASQRHNLPSREKDSFIDPPLSPFIPRAV
jgi:hypothetical protein